MTTCPGCGLEMPARSDAPADGYFNTSRECWSVFTEVAGAEFSNALIFGRVHQLTVDAYAVQHAGGPHPDKSVDIHLVGLHLVNECGIAPTAAPPLMQRLASAVAEWPHFERPRVEWTKTIFDVALAAGDSEQHVHAVRAWSGTVWRAWAAHHAAIAELAALVMKK